MDPAQTKKKILFDAVSKFVEALGMQFGDKQHSLALYARLISKTEFTNDATVNRHLDAFEEYITLNKEAIENATEEKLQGTIRFSNRVFVNLNNIFSLADKETKTIIWQHLLTIVGLMTSSERARETLKTMTVAATPETDLIQRMVEKITPHLEASNTENPISAIMALLQSGVFGELVSSMQSGVDNGEIDPTKLMSDATKIFNETKDTSKQ